MRVRALRWTEALRSSYWFVPSCLAAAAVLASFATLAADRAWGDAVVRALPWFDAGTPQAARTFLSAVVGSTITVASVVFSITILVLSQASSQFGPRLILNFMRDRGTHAVLGIFVATFLYCILILRDVRGTYVPHLSVFCALGMATISFGALIFFVHHMSSAIQAPHVVESAGLALKETIHHVYPETAEEEGEPQPEEAEPFDREEFSKSARPVSSSGSGYVQTVDGATLFALACERNLLVSQERRPGDFVTEGDTLLRVQPADALDEALLARLRALFALGARRTPTQDVEFALRELVEIAVRALSPAVNDPFTAMTCLDRLGESLVLLAKKKIPPPLRREESGRLRVVAIPPSYASVVDLCFSQIRHNARDNPVVSAHLLDVLAVVARRTRKEEHKKALRLQADWTLRGVEISVKLEEDRQSVAAKHRAVLAALGESVP